MASFNTHALANTTTPTTLSTPPPRSIKLSPRKTVFFDSHLVQCRNVERKGIWSAAVQHEVELRTFSLNLTEGAKNVRGLHRQSIQRQYTTCPQILKVEVISNQVASGYRVDFWSLGFLLCDQLCIVLADDSNQQIDCCCITNLNHVPLTNSLPSNVRKLDSVQVLPGPCLVLTFQTFHKNEFEIQEWYPETNKVRKASIRAHQVLDIVDLGPGSIGNRQWCVLYSHSVAPHGIKIGIMDNHRERNANSLTRSDDQTVEVVSSPSTTLLLDSIPVNFRSKNNIQSIVLPFVMMNALAITQRRGLYASIPTKICSLWVLTKSGELAYFSNGSLVWSVPLDSATCSIWEVKLLWAEEQMRSTLLVRAESGTFLLSADKGSVIQRWFKEDVAVVEQDPSDSIWPGLLSFPEDYQPQFEDSPEVTTFQEAGIRMFSDAASFGLQNNFKQATGDSETGLENLDMALKAASAQLEAKERYVKQLERTLTYKRELVQECRDLLEGPLNSVFRGSVVPANGSGSTDSLSLSWNEKRRRYRKKVLERLVPIVGSLSDVSPSEQVLQGRRQLGEANLKLITLTECVTGKLKLPTGHQLWAAVTIKNCSKNIISSLHVVMTEAASQSRVHPKLHPGQVTTLVAIASPTDFSGNRGTIGFLPWMHASNVVKLDSALVHFLTANDVDDQQSQSHVVSAPTFQDVMQVPITCLDYIEQTLLSSCASFTIQDFPHDRMMKLLQDGCGLQKGVNGASMDCPSSTNSGNENNHNVTFGGLEDGVKVIITAESLSVEGLSSYDIEVSALSEPFLDQMVASIIALQPSYVLDTL